MYHNKCMLYVLGLREAVYDSMADAYAHMGQPPPAEVEEEAGMMEVLFEAVSKHLSVLEAMSLMWGENTATVRYAAQGSVQEGGQLEIS